MPADGEQESPSELRNMAQPLSTLDTTRATTGAHLSNDASPNQSRQPDEEIDDGDAFPRKKRRKLAIDERKRAIKA